MSGGKKAKRGRTAKKKQAEAAVTAVKRNTAFIETSDGPERVLPLEIRREIYRYLLLGRNVKKQRDHELWDTKGYADYYAFQVNILRVSKAIHVEARQILYEENVFAVLSTKDSSFPHRQGRHVVPFVSYNFAAVDRFSEHSLYMRYENPFGESAHGEHINCECGYCRAAATERRMLLLSEDLPAFFRVCRALNHMELNPTFFIIDQPCDGTFGFRPPFVKRQTSYASFKFSNSSPAAFVERTLTQLRKVPGDRSIEIEAPSHPKLAAACKDAMTPKVVWGYAIAWDLVELSHELKADADQIIKTSSAEPKHVDRLALMLYGQILKLLDSSMISRRLGGDAPTFANQFCKSQTDGCRCWDWTEPFAMLNLDLHTACICLNLLSGLNDTAATHMPDVVRFMLQCGRLPDETAAHAHHVLAFLHTKKSNCTEALSSLKLAQTHRQMAGLDPDEGLERDVRKHVKYMKTNGGKGIKGTDIYRSYCRSSFVGKSYVANNSHFDGVQPSGISAWKDYEYQLCERDLKAMGLTRKDVPPPIPRIRKATAFDDPSNQMEDMHLSS